MAPLPLGLIRLHTFDLEDKPVRPLESNRAREKRGERLDPDS
jgi:hypothetical protein